MADVSPSRIKAVVSKTKAKPKKKEKKEKKEKSVPNQEAIYGKLKGTKREREEKSQETSNMIAETWIEQKRVCDHTSFPINESELINFGSAYTKCDFCGGTLKIKAEVTLDEADTIKERKKTVKRLKNLGGSSVWARSKRRWDASDDEYRCNLCGYITSDKHELCRSFDLEVHTGGHCLECCKVEPRKPECGLPHTKKE